MLKPIQGATIQKNRLSSQVREILKKSILENEVGLGEKLPPENQIAKMLNVSSVTVREALKELETEGLIEKRRGIYGGSFVAQPGPEKMIQLIANYYRSGGITPEELVELRQLLEPPLIALAVERRTEEDLKALEQNIREMEQCLERGEVNKRIAIEFHYLIAQSCHNRLISAIMGALVDVFEEIISKIPMTIEDGYCDLGDSKEFYGFILHGKREAARKLMIDHFDTLDTIIKRNKNTQHEDREKHEDHSG